MTVLVRFHCSINSDNCPAGAYQHHVSGTQQQHRSFLHFPNVVLARFSPPNVRRGLSLPTTCFLRYLKLSLDQDGGSEFNHFCETGHRSFRFHLGPSVVHSIWSVSGPFDWVRQWSIPFGLSVVHSSIIINVSMSPWTLSFHL